MCNTPYSVFVWAYNSCNGHSIVTTLTKSTLNAPAANPSPGTHEASAIQITWHWNSVPGAIKYWWGTTNNIN